MPTLQIPPGYRVLEYDIALPGGRALPITLLNRIGTDEIHGRLPKELLPPEQVDEDEPDYQIA